MTTKRQLFEADRLDRGDTRDDGAFKVRIIKEGLGTSGRYRGEMLQNNHNAFNNRLSFKNHPKDYDNPHERDFTMISGQILGETWTENDKDGLVEVWGWYLPDPDYSDKLDRYRSQLGLSIFIEGDGHINDAGEFEIDYLDADDPYASVDVVIAPGREGKMLVESLRKHYQEEQDVSDGNAVLEAIGTLTSKIDALLTGFEGKAAEQAQVEADQTAVTAAVEAYDEAVAEIDKAELVPELVENLRALAREGKDVSEAIEDAKRLQEAFKTHFADDGEPGGQVRVSENSKGKDNYVLRGFKEAK